MSTASDKISELKEIEDRVTRILISGATGFVGSALVESLGNEKWCELYLISYRNAEQTFKNFASVKEHFLIDLTSEDSCRELRGLGKIDQVIHTAGLAHQFGKVAAEDFFRINVRGTENICRLAADLAAEKVILLSSVAVYGSYGKETVDEDFRCQPSGAYAESKFEAEKKALQICGLNQIALSILRLATVIGENDRGNMMHLITQIYKNRFIWIGKGTNRKSFIYRRDAAEIIKALTKLELKEAEILNLTGEAIEVREIVERIQRVLGKKKSWVNWPASIFRRIGQINRHTIRSRWIVSFEKQLEKWLADDIYSGEKLLRHYQLRPGTRILEALDRQVRDYQTKKK